VPSSLTSRCVVALLSVGREDGQEKEVREKWFVAYKNTLLSCWLLLLYILNTTIHSTPVSGRTFSDVDPAVGGTDQVSVVSAAVNTPVHTVIRQLTQSLLSASVVFLRYVQSRCTTLCCSTASVIFQLLIQELSICHIYNAALR
jgi:hypothetical protein